MVDQRDGRPEPAERLRQLAADDPSPEYPEPRGHLAGVGGLAGSPGAHGVQTLDGRPHGHAAGGDDDGVPRP